MLGKVCKNKPGPRLTASLWNSGGTFNGERGWFKLGKGCQKNKRGLRLAASFRKG